METTTEGFGFRNILPLALKSLKQVELSGVLPRCAGGRMPEERHPALPTQTAWALNPKPRARPPKGNTTWGLRLRAQGIQAYKQ